MKFQRIFKTCISTLAVGMISVFAAQAADKPDTINVSYVKSPFNLQLMVTKKLGLLDKEFGKDGITISWHDLTSGAHQTQAMAAGSLDIGGVVGSASILLANGGGNPVKIIGGVSRPQETFALVVPADGATSIPGLKGKTIAGPKGTTLHQMLLAALARENMEASDVNLVTMDLPKARAALLGGHVDGALLAATHVINAEKAGARVLVTAAGLISPTLVIAAREGFVTDHPDLVKRYLKVHKEAMAYIRDHEAEALAIGAEEQGLSAEDAEKLYKWAGLTNRLVPEDAESLQADMDFLVENGLMRQPIDLGAVILPVSFE